MGGSKVAVELAAAMTGLGWKCDIISTPEIRDLVSPDGRLTAPEALKVYLQANAASYDVVDYDFAYLPYDRDLFPKNPLFVARSVLLIHHLTEIKIPEPKSLGFRLRKWIDLRGERRDRKTFFEHGDRTLRAADLVNVANGRDREILMRLRVNQNIVVLPYGIDAVRRPLFDAIASTPPAEPKVAFVGSFDYRKGCLDFPKIAARIFQQVPGVTFRLMGTASLFQTEREVRRFFPADLQSRLEIIPRYATQELPGLLGDCSAGIFPSYWEGFGFGLIEMLAAAVPVVAYDSPGPCSILPAEKLAPPGQTGIMADKIINMLKDRDLLQSERIAARNLSQQFNWPKIAGDTAEVYLKYLNRETTPKTMSRV
jgi:glycosyltransferase involved in cell wall biosynthesis